MIAWALNSKNYAKYMKDCGLNKTQDKIFMQEILVKKKYTTDNIDE